MDSADFEADLASKFNRWTRWIAFVWEKSSRPLVSPKQLTTRTLDPARTLVPGTLVPLGHWSLGHWFPQKN